MENQKKLPVSFLNKNGQKLGETAVNDTWHIEIPLAGKIPEGTSKIEVRLENGYIFKIIHGGRNAMINLLRAAGTGNASIFEKNTENDDDNRRYLFFQSNPSVIQVPEK